MTTNTVLLIVAVLLIIAALFVYFTNKNIANNLYLKIHKENSNNNASASPYSVKREYSTFNDVNYYFIYKDAKKVNAQKFYSAHNAQTSMNELEKLDGYKPTEMV